MVAVIRHVYFIVHLSEMKSFDYSYGKRVTEMKEWYHQAVLAT